MLLGHNTPLSINCFWDTIPACPSNVLGHDTPLSIKCFWDTIPACPSNASGTRYPPVHQLLLGHDTPLSIKCFRDVTDLSSAIPSKVAAVPDSFLMAARLDMTDLSRGSVRRMPVVSRACAREFRVASSHGVWHELRCVNVCVAK